MQTRLTLPKIAGLVALAFGALTLFAGARALFGGADMGAVVPFVLWFNFCAGFAYILAGTGLWREARWAAALSLAIAVATLGVFGAFLVHVAAGGAWEMRTMAALPFRGLVWLAIAMLALRQLGAGR